MKKIDYNFQPKGLKSELGWYDRGYIPHFEGGAIPQFFTFRLHDSLPKPVVERLLVETQDHGEAGKVEFRKNVEKYLDNGYGQCFLAIPEVAEMVMNSLKFFDGEKYRLHSWVIMPNHKHFLATPFDGVELGEIAHSIKSYTAHEANKLLGRKGQFWQHEPFDRYIRNAEHFRNVVDYIEENPVKAGLCEHSFQWRWSSAYREGFAEATS